MSSKEVLEVLSKCYMFNDLTTREMFYIIGYFEQHTHNVGEILIEEGQMVDDLYIINSGLWEVFLPRNSDYLYRPSEVKLQTLEKGDLLGEYSFVDGNVASASVRVLEAGSLYSVSRENFEKIVESSNHVGKLIYYNLLRALIIRLRKHNEEMDLMHLLDE